MVVASQLSFGAQRVERRTEAIKQPKPAKQATLVSVAPAPHAANTSVAMPGAAAVLDRAAKSSESESNSPEPRPSALEPVLVPAQQRTGGGAS
jgi:hypothetical protein